MRHRTSWLVLVAAAALVASAPGAHASWPQFGGGATNNFETQVELQAPLSVLWKHNAPPTARRGTKPGVVTAEGRIFLPQDAILYALDAVSGERLWRAPGGEGSPRDLISATPAVAFGVIVVPYNSGNLVAYSVETGEMLWTVRTGQMIRAAPTVVGRTVYVGSDDDYLRAVELATGRLVWRTSQSLSDDIAAPPVFFQDNLYVVTADMRLWSVGADSGNVRWSRRIFGTVLDNAPVVANGRIWIAAGSTMYSYLPSGSHRPHSLQEVETDIYVTPLITDQLWCIADRNGNLYGYSGVGNYLWKTQLDGRVHVTPILAGETVYATTHQGFVYGINAADGAIKWSYRTEPAQGIEPRYSYYPVNSPIAVADGRLYVLTDDGSLTAFSAQAPDLEGPFIAGATPRNGSVINGFPPLTFGAYVWDEGSGINPDSVSLVLDGVEIEQDEVSYQERTTRQRDGWVYHPVRRTLTYTMRTPEGDEQIRPLSNGRHELQISVADWKGNVSVHTWSFTVDNTLPRRDRQQQQQQQQRQQQQRGAGDGGIGDAGIGDAGGPGQQAGVDPGAAGARGQYARGAYGAQPQVGTQPQWPAAGGAQQYGSGPLYPAGMQQFGGLANPGMDGYGAWPRGNPYGQWPGQQFGGPGPTIVPYHGNYGTIIHGPGGSFGYGYPPGW